MSHCASEKCRLWSQELWTLQIAGIAALGETRRD